MGLGDKIKIIRNEKGFSLRDLASQVELSASFLSQIEQGKASPSIENLKKIANALDVRVSYLIEDEEGKKNAVLIKKEERYVVESIDSGTKIALLSSGDIEKNMEPIYYEIKPNGESGRGYYHHPGEEFVYVVEGKIDIYINENQYSLEAGDSLYFKSKQKHRFKNNSKEIAKVIWIVTPPTF